MNKERKTAVVEEIAGQISEAEAVFAVDYRGISVPQAAELRSKLRDADATFRVVKNSLTERAAEQAGAQSLRELLEGPTAFTFVRGDAALAAKALNDFARQSGLLPFKGGVMDGTPVSVEELQAIARLPAREVLHAQLVGTVAAPLTGLVRGLGSMVAGLAVALGQVQEKKESGEIPAGEAPQASAEAAEEEGAPEAAEAEGVPEAAEAEAESSDAAEVAAAEGGEEQTEAAEEAAAETEAAPAEGAETETSEDAGEQAGDEPSEDESSQDKE